MIKYAKLFFIVFIFGLLVVPLCHMNKGDKLLSENRMMATFPELIKKNKINYSYGKEFDDWLNDRFFGRKGFLNLYKFFNRFNSCIRNRKAVYFKSNGWMFLNTEKLKRMDPEKIQRTIDQIKEVSAFCQQHHIKMYVLLTPFKESVYYQYIADKNISADEIEEYLSDFREFENQLGNTFVFPYDELKKASEKDLVFFRETHHWTDYGAYLGYLKLMDHISKDFKGIHPVSLNDYKKFTNNLIRDDFDRAFNMGTITGMVVHSRYAKKHVLNKGYTYYDHLHPIEPEIRDVSGYKTKRFFNPRGKYKVFLTGYSHNENLVPFLPYSFKEVNYYRLNHAKDVKSEEWDEFFKRYKKDLLEYKPDILIFTVMPEKLFSDKLWQLD